jgi:hypothetical protein
MQPHYYLMKSKKILRLEADMAFSSLPSGLRSFVLDESDIISMDQAQANWRVAIFRDEIMELEEFISWTTSPEALLEEEAELELVAN